MARSFPLPDARALTPQPVHWIDQPAQVGPLCQQLLNQPRLAVDTEFVRTNTYYPIPGLIQIATPTDIYLVDPVRLNQADLQPLGECLFTAGKQLLMHSGGEDLELFQLIWNRLPSQLLDTQIAASFVGYDRQTGLQRLLKEALDVELGKEETRSDWTRRPLTDAQIHYAAEDVRHLFTLAAQLEDKLALLDRAEWCAEECNALLKKYRKRTPDDQLYLGFSSGARFGPEQQAALQHLAAWREENARKRNIPRTFIAKDAVLYGLVDKQPKHRGLLEDIGVQGGQIRRWGDELIRQLQVGLQKARPSAPIPQPLSKRQQVQYKELRQVLVELATEIGIAPEVLAGKSQLSDYLQQRSAGDAGQRVFNGWRSKILQPRLDAHSFKKPDNTSKDQDPDE